MPAPIDLDEIAALLKWAESDARNADAGQVAKLRAILENRSVRAASRALGINQSAMSQTIVRLRARKARYSRVDHLGDNAAPGYAIKGTSTMYDGDGAVRAQWVKTKQEDTDKAEAMEAWVDSLCERVAGKAKPVKAPRHDATDLLSVYPWGDPHVGMLAWKDEAGSDFDIHIARRDILAAMQILADSSAPSHDALLLSLGDLFHADNQAGVTSRSGNPLDVDTRLGKVTEAVEEIVTESVAVLLRKHHRVRIKTIKGNHDDVMSFVLGRILAAYYRDEPRVLVDTSPSDFYYLRWGKCLIGSTHGHGPKPTDLPGIMAHDRPTDWGETAHRYWLTGHIHNKQRMEFPGVEWESFRNLAPNDAWHQGKGYRSGRDAYCITYHREHGEIIRHRADIGRVRAA